jgi:hypothetical protein
MHQQSQTFVPSSLDPRRAFEEMMQDKMSRRDHRDEFPSFRSQLAEGVMKSADIEAAARLLCGAALNAALWVAASDDPQSVLPKAVDAFRLMAEGFRSERR